MADFSRSTALVDRRRRDQGTESAKDFSGNTPHLESLYTHSNQVDPDMDMVYST